jgi:hypothetical protein
VDAASKSTIDDALKDAKTALESNDAEQMKGAMERLNKAQHKLAEAMYAKASAAQGAGPGGPGAGGPTAMRRRAGGQARRRRRCRLRGSEGIRTTDSRISHPCDPWFSFRGLLDFRGGLLYF